MEVYLSGSDCCEKDMAVKLDRIYAQVRAEKLGAQIKSAVIDADGDAVFNVKPELESTLARLAQCERLRLWQFGASG